MNLSEWREKQKGEQHELPSGLVVRLRRVQLLDLVSQGQVPAPLFAAANEILNQPETTLTVEIYEKFSAVIKLIARACIVEPPITDEPGEASLGIDELPAADLMAIYNWANQVLVAVRPFRPERSGDEGARRAGKGLRKPAKPDPGDR